MKKRIQLLATVTLTAIGIALSPKAQAVVPPPDGGYPGFTTAEGTNALQSLTTGIANTAVGWHSLFSNSGGSFNTATGAGTLLFNTADQNTAFGAAALLFNMTGSGNTATGAAALLNNTAGTDNTAVGASALINSIGSGNIALGANAGANVVNANNVICIGAVGEDTNGTCFIGNIFNEPVFSGTAVFITPKGRLGTILPSRRLTKDIQSMDEASEVILALKPVTFRYTIDPNGAAQFGLIAEEVAQVNSDLVVRDENGDIYSVRYDVVNAMLLNEFLKEHRIVQEQGAIIARQQKQIDALTAGLQKVSAQLELNKPAPQTVEDNH